MAQTALITGASGGIGYELAKVFAQHQYDVILVARSTDKLLQIQTELSQQYGVQATALTHDLSDHAAPQRLFDQLKAQHRQIDVLVNNAGFGDNGAFATSDWEKQNSMLQLNIVALTHLTRLFLPSLIEQGRGQVMNVASTAAFQPGPYMAVYYASKAYVLSFTEAISHELQGTGVSAIALCPGPTRSDFQDRANLNDVEFFDASKIPAAAEVAQFGYDALQRDQTVAVHGAVNQLLAFSNRIMPRQAIVKFIGDLQKPKG
ncbi:MAG: SDR family oxidoreductase [Cyanobacteria bacterium P01_A01_bin.105]